jgi:hypothetical protein
MEGLAGDVPNPDFGKSEIKSIIKRYLSGVFMSFLWGRTPV